MLKYKTEIFEFFIIIAVGCVFYYFKHYNLEWLIVFWALAKTFFFFFENAKNLLEATAIDIAYHKFLTVIIYNIGQVTFSFGLDFFCIYQTNSANFVGVNHEFTMFEQLFEFFYFSVLNFTFFGYGDLMPATIPAKLILLFEVIIAFLTIVFILSDFISMKESLKKNSPDDKN